jgi:hypothetical protein
MQPIHSILGVLNNSCLKLWCFRALQTLALLGVAGHSDAIFAREGLSGSTKSSSDDGEPSGPDLGPWKVKVPKLFQANGYGLHLRGKYLSLGSDTITISGRDTTEFVGLLDSRGRIVDLRKVPVTQHLLTGFSAKQFRMAAGVGLGINSSKLVDDRLIPAAVWRQTFDVSYQPSTVGILLGTGLAAGSVTGAKSDTGSGSAETNGAGTTNRYTSVELRLGGQLGFGLNQWGRNYRWQALAQAGVLLSAHGVALGDQQSTTNTSGSSSSDTGGSNSDSSNSRGGGATGVFGGLDIFYVWPVWSIGGRFTARSESISGRDRGLNGSLNSVSIELLGAGSI